MTPLWIFLICFPFGAFILIWVVATAMKPYVVEEEEDDDILEEAEGYEDDDEEQVIVDIADGTGVPAPSRPQITMNASGVGAGRRASGAAKSGAAPTGTAVASLKKTSETKPAVKSAPTVAANGMPIRPKQ